MEGSPFSLIRHLNESFVQNLPAFLYSATDAPLPLLEQYNDHVIRLLDTVLVTPGVVSALEKIRLKHVEIVELATAQVAGSRGGTMAGNTHTEALLKEKAAHFQSLLELADLASAKDSEHDSALSIQEAIMGAPIGVTVLRGPELIAEMANQTYLNIIDKSSHEFIGFSLYTSLPEVRPAVEPLFQEIFRSGKPYYGSEFPVQLRRFGRVDTTYFNFVYYPLFNANGSVNGVIVVATEVTELVVSKFELQEKEAKFRNIVLHSPIAMTIFRGPDFIIELANNFLLQHIWRKTSEEVLGKKLLEVFPELHSQPFPELLNKVRATGIAHRDKEALAIVNSHDGSKEYYLDFEYAPLREADSSISGIMVTVNDVTEKVEARRRIEKSEQQFRVLASVLPQFIWTATAEGNLNYFSQSLFDYARIPQHEVSNFTWLQLLHPDDKQSSLDAWEEAKKAGRVYEMEHRFRRFDGEYRWYATKTIPQFDEQGKLQLWVGTATDIHERTLLSQDLSTQIMARNKELKQSNERLLRSNSELLQFAYVASHDLQEPLRKIQTFVSRIADSEFHKLSPKGQDYFTRIERASSRTQRLIKDLLAYSRANATEKNLTRMHLGDLLKKVLQDLQESMEEKKAVIHISELPTLPVIPFQIEQLYTNLLMNALKFSRPSTAPVISIQSKKIKGDQMGIQGAETFKDYYQLTFSDNGIGFDPQFRDRIFLVFQRLHAKEEYEGTGIGLAICKKIVENHDGFITADGNPQQGAAFHVYLPA